MSLDSPVCHALLLDLAGQIPDRWLVTCRSLLAQGRLAEFATEVAQATAADRIGLGSEQIDLLERLGADPAALGQVPLGADGVAPLAYDFAGAPPAGWLAEGHEEQLVEAVVAACSAEPGVRGVWHAWRTIPRSLDPNPKMIFVVETDVDPIAVTDRLTRAGLMSGEADPQIEAYDVGAKLPYYQRLVRDSGTLIWARAAASTFRLARIFDEVRHDTGPAFADDHPRIADPEDAERIVGYLRSGATLLTTMARMDDVVRPERRNTVPMNFRTDGLWIWTDTATYYLEEYGLEPDPELVAAIRTAGYSVGIVDGVAQQRALAYLSEPDPTDEPVWSPS